jgi:hypothetical protein
MPRYEASAVWDAVKKKTVEEHGKTAFQRVTGQHQWRKRLEHWLEEEDVCLDDETDVQDAADAFLAHHDYDFWSVTDFEPTSGPHRAMVKGGGSLSRLAAYAEALPAVLRARAEVLDTREPMPFTEAVDWLVREAQGSEDRVLVDVRFRFLLPKTSPALWILNGGMPGPEFLSALDRAAIATPLAPGAQRPAQRPAETSLTMLIGSDGERVEIDLLKGDSAKLGKLLSWANRLAGRCVGGVTTVDSLDYPEALGAAIWLVLAGIWPRVSAAATIYPSRGWALVAGAHRPRPQSPYMLMRIETMDTPPDLVRSAYQDLRVRNVEKVNRSTLGN